ncbi:hypothetical protein EC973_008075 [Apophysomyces ossiformis]|uniref:Uncharacterized protein n=1 Tax=Apophysomyces ossiformis TaxID=679940 RepID=A0A8H7BR03_9FUNG|nr:hypothetical protein EC973_008075 [Apophysomyces ossiformis]
MGDSDPSKKHQESPITTTSIVTTGSTPATMSTSVFDHRNQPYTNSWGPYPNRWCFVTTAPVPSVPLIPPPLQGNIHRPMVFQPFYGPRYPYYAETEHYPYPYHHHRPPVMRPAVSEMGQFSMTDQFPHSMQCPTEYPWPMVMPMRPPPPGTDSVISAGTTVYSSPGQQQQEKPPVNSGFSSPTSPGSVTSRKGGQPKRRRSLEGLETELAFLRDESATIGIMLHSLRNAFQANAPMMCKSKKVVTSHKEDVDREMRTAYDDLMLQVKQLEKKVEKLESKIKDICEQVAEGKKEQQEEAEEEAARAKRRRVSTSDN